MAAQRAATSLEFIANQKTIMESRPKPNEATGLGPER